MGNKLYIDTKISQIEDIINMDSDLLKNIEIENEETGFQNIKVWRFYETNDDSIKSEAILLPNIKEDHFLLSSLESYIILLIYKGKDDISDISAFPTSLWGIVESSSNMTPRGLKYAFSTSNDKSENLESFLLSKRDFKNSDFKYVLFIWNGKQCVPLLKSTVLMRAFDLDKKLSNAEIIPYLYYGYSVKDNSIQKGKTVKLNDILSNTFETLTEDNLQTPSSESLVNYQETVYLLQWLYPNKKVEKKSPSKKRMLFKKFNSAFLGNNTKNYYDLFANLDKSSTRKAVFDEANEKEQFKLNPIKMPENKRESDANANLAEDEESERNEDSNENDSLISLNEVEEEEEEADVVDDMNLISTRNDVNKLSLNQGANKLNLKKINLGDIYNKTNSSTDTDNNSTNAKDIKVPKLNMKLQHKLLNEDIISQRTKQISEDEEKLDTLASNTIRKASDMILSNKDSMMKKLDLKGLDKGQQNQNSNFNLNFKVNLKQSRNTGIQLEKENDNLDFEKLNDDYDMKETDRKKVVMDYFSKNMSEIIDEFLFLSSYNVAKNKEIVYKNKITHIINSAADICQNHFPENITYLSFNLKDHAMENIECVFYEVIKFIEAAREKNGRVLVHCIQGISRSVTLVIAYLILTKKLNYDEAFKIVQSRRSIASPNLGFAIQLQNFYQRLFEPPQTFRLYPKIFAIGSFQVEQPEKIVCRLTQEQFFELRLNNTIRVFDKRGVYIVVSLDKVYMWIGSMIYPKVRDHYLSVAKNYINDLKKYENAPSEIIEIEDGNEPKEFINIWFDDEEKFQSFLQRSRFSESGSDGTNWYKDVDVSSLIAEKMNKENSAEAMANSDKNDEEVKNLPKVRKAFYIYPEEENPENLIDLDDLGNDDFFVACYEDSTDHKYMMFVWKGPSVQIDAEESEEYLDNIKNKFFEKENIESVTIIEEVPYSESDEFINML